MESEVKLPAFPEPEWFVGLGRLMEAEGEAFRRLGYAEVRFAIRIRSDDGERAEPTIGLEFNRYTLVRDEAVGDTSAFDPDFVICGRRENLGADADRNPPERTSRRAPHAQLARADG